MGDKSSVGGERGETGRRRRKDSDKDDVRRRRKKSRDRPDTSPQIHIDKADWMCEWLFSQDEQRLQGDIYQTCKLWEGMGPFNTWTTVACYMGSIFLLLCLFVLTFTAKSPLTFDVHLCAFSGPEHHCTQKQHF